MFALPTLLAPLLVAPAPPAGAAAAPFHCQVPCGIYGDHLRVELLREHATTIEKAMKDIAKLSGELNEPKDYNQLVRWVTTKDEHAQKIQDQLAQYWLAQRVKKADLGDESEEGRKARRLYSAQLVALHEMTVAAMKCKQEVSEEHVRSFRRALDDFSSAYFSPEELKHIQGHKEGSSGDSGGGGGTARAERSRAGDRGHVHDHDHGDE